MVPTLVSSLALGLGINAFAQVSGGYLYVSEYSNGSVAIYSLADPRTPVFTGRALSTGRGNVRSLVTDGRYVYMTVSAPANAIDVVDVANKAAPFVVASFSLSPADFPKEIVRHGDDLYVVCNSNQVQQWRIVSPTVLTRVAEIVNNPVMISVAVANGHVFAGSLTGSLDVYDLNLTYRSSVAVNHVTNGNVTSVQAVDGLVYTLTPAGIKIFDTSNPLALGLLASLPMEPGAISLKVHGDRLYVVCGDNVQSSLVVFDRSIPSAPVRLGSVALVTGTAGFLAIGGGYGYITGHFAPLAIDTVFF